MPSGTSRQVIIVYKPHTHPHRSKVGLKWELAKSGAKWKKGWYDDPGGSGLQIDREIPVCPACKKAHEDRQRGQPE